MKITIVCGFFLPMPPEAGGAMEKMWWRLAKVYTQRGHIVTLISRCWHNWPHDEVRNGVRFIRVPGANHRAALWKNLILDSCWGFRVLRKLPAADILITNTIALPAFSPYLRPDAGKLVVNLNRYPKTQLRYYRRAARIQVPTKAIATAACSQAPTHTRRIKLVPNSIDCSQFVAAKQTVTEAPPVLKIGFFGRIHAEKGVHTLVRAAALIAEQQKSTGNGSESIPWQLVLRGPTDIPRGGGGARYVQQLRSLAPELWASDQIVLEAPTFNEKELAKAYASLAIFCYPSEAEKGETQGISIIEAMASGLAVVTSDLAVFQDYLKQGKDSLNFPMGDAQKLAEALRRLLCDNELRQRLGTAAQKVALRFDDAQIATEHLADYESLLANSADV